MNSINKKVTIWFPTLIYEDILTEFNTYNSHLETKVYNIRQKSPTSKTNWSCDTYSTLFQYNGLKDSDTVIQNLINVCKEKVIDFASEYGIKKNINELECIDFWFNIAQPGSYQEYHLHPKSQFSVIYYVKTTPGCGNIVFQNNESLVDMFPLFAEEATYASYKNCFYTPKDSLMLIFRSNLLHMVEKNLSNENRISIAMNFTFKEGYDYVGDD
jgi:uncharacterized protein (TIGR02466 family)